MEEQKWRKIMAKKQTRQNPNPLGLTNKLVTHLGDEVRLKEEENRFATWWGLKA